MQFTKYEAAGNDFIVVDARKNPQDYVFCQHHACRLCDRHFGIGADGILVITQTISDLKDTSMNAAMHVINSDGSVAAMCGNGIRCVARHLYEYDGISTNCTLRIGTLGGMQQVNCLDVSDEYWYIEVILQRAVLGQICKITQNGRFWCGQCVDVGNPHAVFEIDSDPRDALQIAGEFLSNHETFPDRCNIEFIHALDERTLDFTVYERGAGPTLACGTGCVAAATAFAHHHDLKGQTIEIHAPGGILKVIVPLDPAEPPHLIGPARRVFWGNV